MAYMKLVFEAKDPNAMVHRLLLFPELKVYAKGIIVESKYDSIELNSVLDMYEIEKKLMLNGYIMKSLSEAEKGD